MCASGAAPEGTLGRMDHQSVHERLRQVAADLEDGPAGTAERGARELLGKLDALQAELERLQRGLEGAAHRLAARPDGPPR